MALSSAQRRHLVSAYTTVSHLLRQMEEAGAEGRSPTGVGSPLTPLPLEEVSAVCASLRELQVLLREHAAALAPEELAAFERPQALGNTRVWLSNLREKIRASVDSLHPDQMRKYGPQPEADREVLAALHGDLAVAVQQARAVLEKQA